jgi:hypothetical protein
LRRTQLFYFVDAKVVGRSTRLWLLFLRDLPANKSRQIGRRLFGLPAAILQIERDPPTASELSKLKYQ